jgi:CelD/BcsL family acetyltransferase involved in cellulose biosynthesis
VHAAVVSQQRGDALGLRIEVSDSLVDVRDELSRLAEESENVFATPEWLETWWKHFGSGRMRIRALRDPDGRLVALLPLYLTRRGPLRVMRFLGHGPGDQLGPVCAPSDRAAAASALHDVLGSERFDVFLGEELPGDAPWSLPGQTYRRSGSPLADLRGATWEDYLSTRSRKLRKAAARLREERLRRDFGGRFRPGDPSQFESDFDTLLALHDLRWPPGTSLFGGRERAFQQEFAQLARDRGWLRLWFLELDGRPAAAWYGFRFGDTYGAYQSGRDPAFAQLSIGTALDLHTIRVACQEGVREYRLLRGEERYKYRLATDDRGLVSIAVGRGPLGRSLLSLRFRLRRNSGAESGCTGSVTRSGYGEDHPSSA